MCPAWSHWWYRCAEGGNLPDDFLAYAPRLQYLKMWRPFPVPPKDLQRQLDGVPLRALSWQTPAPGSPTAFMCSFR